MILGVKLVHLEGIRQQQKMKKIDLLSKGFRTNELADLLNIS